MTTLVFPESGPDWAAAFNNGLAQGAFTTDRASSKFWALFELLAAEVEDGVVVADMFKQQHTFEYVRIPRTTEVTER